VLGEFFSEQRIHFSKALLKLMHAHKYFNLLFLKHNETNPSNVKKTRSSCACVDGAVQR
jgi:hypothetical protein